MRKNLFNLLMLVFVVILVTYCKKEKEENNNQDFTNDYIQAAQDNSLCDNMFSDVHKQANFGGTKMDDSLQGKKSLYNNLSACATITITPWDLTTWPKTVTIDFGSTNCLCNDGRYRRGKIILVATGFYHDSGTVITVTPQNYYVNDHKIEGQKVITNNGRNQEGHLVFTINVTNGKVTAPDGTYRTWNSIRTHEWLNGENTINPWDDEYKITGGANGKTKNNRNYTITIINPLNISTGCKWIRGGSLSLTVENNQPIYINYGSSNECDDEAVITINGQNYTIHMGN
ncbi:MAG: hypothetical protein N3A01_06660 [Bacteroidales bacterium]|nr:hypothetical protein [Bacteroidales bacterium]